MLEQIALLEQATGELSDISQKKARDESHKLIGSLGILGLPQGSEIAQQIEMLLEPQVSSEEQQELSLSVQKLRLLVENASPLHQEKQASKQPQIDTQTRLLIVDEDREFIDRLVSQSHIRRNTNSDRLEPQISSRQQLIGLVQILSC